MQYSGAKLLSQRLNPYKIFVQEGLGGSFILAQGPPYLHPIYILLSPLSILDFRRALQVFNFINYLLAFASCLFLSRVYKLTFIRAALLTIFLFSFPSFAHCITNGQLSLFILFFLCLGTYLISSANPLLIRFGSVINGLAYIKYNLAPAIGSLVWRSLGRSPFLLTFILPLFSILLFGLVTSFDQFTFLGPLLSISKRWAWEYVDVGMSDLHSLFDSLFLWKPDLNHPLEISNPFLILVPIIALTVSGALPWIISRFNPQLTFVQILPLVIPLVLTLAKHLPYDNLLLIITFAFILSFKTFPTRSFSTAILLISMSWQWVYPYFAPYLLSLDIQAPVSEPLGIFIGVLCNVMLFVGSSNLSSSFNTRTVSN